MDDVVTFCHREFNPFLCWAEKGMWTPAWETACIGGVSQTLQGAAKEPSVGEDQGLPSDLEGAEVEDGAAFLGHRDLREEQRGQGKGWLWEDSDDVGEGYCPDLETHGGEQYLVLWSLALGAGARREMDLSMCGALRVRDQEGRSTAYLKTHFAISNGGDCVDLALGEDERLKSKALGGCGVIT